MIRKAHRPLGLVGCGAVLIFALSLSIGSGSLAKEHPPISPPEAAQASDGHNEAAAAGGVCANCHQDKLSYPAKHPIIELAGCEGCHEASQKDGKWNVKLVAEGNELCFLCHDDKKPQTKAGVRSHFPTVEGECLACHDPHGSPEQFMLQGPVGEVSEQNLCFTCHTNIEELTKKETVHGALQWDAWFAIKRIKEETPPSRSSRST